MDPAFSSGVENGAAIRPKCLFIALISSWVVAIFLPSFLIGAAAAGLTGALAEARCAARHYARP